MSGMRFYQHSEPASPSIEFIYILPVDDGPTFLTNNTQIWEGTGGDPVVSSTKLADDGRAIYKSKKWIRVGRFGSFCGPPLIHFSTLFLLLYPPASLVNEFKKHGRGLLLSMN